MQLLEIMFLKIKVMIKNEVKMNEEKYQYVKKINYYKEIIENLRKEIAELINENEHLKYRIKDLEEINLSHQELVGDLLSYKKMKNEK